MNAQHQDAIELKDYGDAGRETRQYWFSVEYPDNHFQRGPYPGGLEYSAEHPIDYPTL